ncbi:MAG: hypothetical protein EPO30_11245 [Lysobacteraceae bacterium]|nr:MAG: hypothetical protein EPO30_11245 [Xanthomonadaceae bacterium]
MALNFIVRADGDDDVTPHGYGLGFRLFIVNGDNLSVAEDEIGGFGLRTTTHRKKEKANKRCESGNLVTHTG